jgi:hypothetical protein
LSERVTVLDSLTLLSTRLSERVRADTAAAAGAEHPVNQRLGGRIHSAFGIHATAAGVGSVSDLVDDKSGENDCVKLVATAWQDRMKRCRGASATDVGCGDRMGQCHELPWTYPRYDEETMGAAARELSLALATGRMWADVPGGSANDMMAYVRAAPCGTDPRVRVDDAGRLLADVCPIVAGGGRSPVFVGEIAVALRPGMGLCWSSVGCTRIEFDNVTLRALQRTLCQPGIPAATTESPVGELLSREYSIRTAIVLFVAVCLSHKGDRSHTRAALTDSVSVMRCIVHTLLAHGLESVLRSPCIHLTDRPPIDPLKYVFEMAQIGLNAVIATELIQFPFANFDVDAMVAYDDFYDRPQPVLRTPLTRIVSCYPTLGVPATQITSHMCALLDTMCRRVRQNATFNVQSTATDDAYYVTRYLRHSLPLPLPLLADCVEGAASRWHRSLVSLWDSITHACALAHVLLRYARDDGSGVDVNMLFQFVEKDSRRQDTVATFTPLQFLDSKLQHPNAPGSPSDPLNRSELYRHELETVRSQLMDVRTALAAAETRRAHYSTQLSPTLMAAVSADTSGPTFPNVLARLIATYILFS